MSNPLDRCLPLRRPSALVSQHFRRWIPVAISAILLTCPVGSIAQSNLTELISKAKDKSQLSVAAGTYAEPLTIDKPVQIIGTDAKTCILEVTSDQPAMNITTRMPVVIEGFTIKWQLETSQGSGPSAALFTKDGNVTIRNCRFVALGGDRRCPAAVSADGFSKVAIEKCEFDGFEFTIGFSGGTEAKLTDSVIVNPGHCGITVGAGSKLEAVGNIVARSKYHGVRCTGGTLILQRNLIVENENRGVYLGNKSARGNVSNNVIIGNTTGISAFAQSSVTIQNNVIADSQFAGLDSRGSCRLKIKNNLFCGNTQGLMLLEPTGKSSVVVGKNSFWKNESNSKDIQLPASTIEEDPQFRSKQDGDFSVQSKVLITQKQGLAHPETMLLLWQKWQAISQGHDVETAQTGTL